MINQSAIPAPKLNMKNPLLKFSLQGQAANLDEMAVAQTPILGAFCLAGQGTVLCAPPNAGKTLITLALLIEAIEAGRIRGEEVFYVDADDTTQGVADKVRLLDEYGVHVIAEGYGGFKAKMLAEYLEEMIGTGSARGKFPILDTFKKFTQPMSKADTSRFTEVIRRFVLAGGSLLCLAHTNKHTNSDGKNVFAGVSDIIDDLDCAYVIDIVIGEKGQRVAKLTNKKRRGDNPDSVAYSYSPEPGLSYATRLTTVAESDPFELANDADLDPGITDEDLLSSIAMAIQHRAGTGKMELVRLIARVRNVSKRRVALLIEQHTGDDPEVHLWSLSVRARGRHAFELLRPLATSE